MNPAKSSLLGPYTCVVVTVSAETPAWICLEAKRQADKVHSRTREFLGLAFSCFRALKERLGMKSDIELSYFVLDK